MGYEEQFKKGYYYKDEEEESLLSAASNRNKKAMDRFEEAMKKGRAIRIM